MDHIQSKIANTTRALWTTNKPIAIIWFSSR